MSMRRLKRPCAPALGGVLACALWAFIPLSAGAATPDAAVPATSAAATAAPSAGDQAGVLKLVQGDVKVLRAGGTAQAAQPGDPVSPLDRIQTGAESGASLRLRDGTVLVIGPNSQLDLKQYQFNATTHEGNILLMLLQGSMRMVSGLIARKQPDAVRIDTQTATIGIRGTDLIVTADAQP